MFRGTPCRFKGTVMNWGLALYKSNFYSLVGQSLKIQFISTFSPSSFFIRIHASIFILYSHFSSFKIILKIAQGLEDVQGLENQQGLEDQQGLLDQQGLEDQQSLLDQQGLEDQQSLLDQQGLENQQGFEDQQGLEDQQG